ncbi:CapA family protein [Actinoplanes sp. NPDC051851]|uniref:CapA family protein n=1 Tax=Actinoplanes sp. NPDC051851 TaxID=3154753 RepID=UPI00341C7893
MNSPLRSHRKPGFHHPVLAVTIVLAAIAGAGLGGAALANWTDNSAKWQIPDNSASVRPASTEESIEVRTISFSAVGDIMMSNAPNRLPANDGAGFFDSVTSGLKADLVMGNLEQPLTEDTGTSKCGTPARANCYAFRSPPSYAEHLKEAGFQLVNTANNHSRDFGTTGYANTVTALEAAGIRHTGATDEITVMEVEGIRVAVLGFSPYAGANDLNDLAHARTIVKKAAGEADLVIVQAHMGAEGSDKAHVTSGTETYYGENRGNPIKFSHAVIDAGADLVIGHGPHVLRGMEFYKGKLIAYSLGNFAGGGGTLSRSGDLKYGGILHATLSSDGQYIGGKFLSTYLDSTGAPTRDAADEHGRALVASLSTADFPKTGAKIAENGTINPAG